jgi:TonB family protein
MNARETTLELNAIRMQTRKGLLWSIGVHVVFFLWLFVFQELVFQEPALTEISWIEPVEAPMVEQVPAVSKGQAVAAQKLDTPRPTPLKREEKFQRRKATDDLEPDPQRAKAVEDIMSARLASLQKEASKNPVDVAALTTPSPVGRPTRAGVSSEKTSRPVDLTRTDKPSPNPISLKRTESRRVQKAGITTTPLADTKIDRARSDKQDTAIRRTLAGAQMAGPVADREIISYSTPQYPEWAKREAVEGSVTIYFVVIPDGRVKENIMVEKTSGFADFDNNAVEALLTWRFQPLGSGGAEQWGRIIFHYRLSD